MKFFNLFLAITLIAISKADMSALDMVREDVVWNYVIEDDKYAPTISVTEDYGYHFCGNREVDGKTYSIYLDGKNEEVALMRQDGGRIYLHLTPEMMKCLENHRGIIDDFDDVYGADTYEMLLYNFELEVGDSYYMPVFFPDSDNFLLERFYVIGLNEVCVDGSMMTFQILSGDYNIVNGIGPDHGMIHRPQLGCLIPSMSYSYALIEDVIHSDGKILFSRKDFNHFIQTRYVVDEFKIWEYTGETTEGSYSYRMRFDGATFADGKFYHILKTCDGKEIWHKNSDVGFTSSDIENGLRFLMREEDGKVYLHAPLGSIEEGYSPWSIDDNEALLYDFNVQEGDELAVIGSDGNLLKGKVTSTISTDVDGSDYKGYTISFDTPQMEFTVMQGMGNVGLGCLPYFIEDVINGQLGSMTYVPNSRDWQRLHRVLCANPEETICQRDADGLWPWEKSNGIAELEAASNISFDGDKVAAVGESLTVYSISGEVVAKGVGEVSTESLQPGVYVAKAGGQTLKILVR